MVKLARVLLTWLVNWQALMADGLLGASKPQPIDDCLKTLGRMMTGGPKVAAVMGSTWQPNDLLSKGSSKGSKVSTPPISLPQVRCVWKLAVNFNYWARVLARPTRHLGAQGGEIIQFISGTKSSSWTAWCTGTPELGVCMKVAVVLTGLCVCAECAEVGADCHGAGT